MDCRLVGSSQYSVSSRYHNRKVRFVKCHTQPRLHIWRKASLKERSRVVSYSLQTSYLFFQPPTRNPQPGTRNPQLKNAQAPSTKFQAPNSRHQIPSTKYQIPNSKFQAPNSKHQIPFPDIFLCDLTFLA
ncbi:hypothetical protein SAMN06296241_3130 [Salinimicrobium sediminis]|uniref:Uncharacterized protein n=1 Tax=Salinimicrobium sediminis TaxID=1343891 RepID=A0A285X8A4_9FLAO|nr:hypothetical protein SAMN06296241_3130 [Salinimicrobium sediminis]